MPVAQEQALKSCALAKIYEAAGNYVAAREALGELWPRVGERPLVDSLDNYAAAHVLLRAGALTGWLGDTQHLTGAQEVARSLLSESCQIFQSIGDSAHTAEAQAEMAWCYWREGSYENARFLLRTALSQLSERNAELKAGTLVRSAVVERMGGRLRDALRLLNEAGPLLESAGENHPLRGRFHGERAVVLRNLGAAERRSDYIDAALIEYAASSFHLEQAGNERFCAYVENNLGFLFATLMRFDEAHTHLDRARRIFTKLGEIGSVAQVDETRSRALLLEARPAQAETVVRAALRLHEERGENAFLAQALTTHATALARMGAHAQALKELRRAIKVAQDSGDLDGAGRAALALIEELSEWVPVSELQVVAAQAAHFLATSQHAETLQRLEACLERVSVSKEGTNVVPLLRKRLRSLESFVVSLCDDSLIGAGIRRGDVVRFKKSSQYKDGDLVAVVTPEGWFVTFIYREPDGRLRLKGAHPRCPVRHFLPQDIHVLGIAE